MRLLKNNKQNYTKTVLKFFFVFNDTEHFQGYETHFTMLLINNTLEQIRTNMQLFNIFLSFFLMSSFLTCYKCEILQVLPAHGSAPHGLTIIMFFVAFRIQLSYMIEFEDLRVYPPCAILAVLYLSPPFQAINI